MERVTGLEHLTMLDIAPPDFVTLAAGAGFGAVGLRISPVTPVEHVWPMSPGSPMLAETARRCQGTGVAVLSVEAIAIGPGAGLAGRAPVIESAAALGARYLNVICDDPDISRFADLFAELTSVALPYGIRPVIEFTAWRPIRTLAAATAVARNSAGGRLLLDTLHIRRCGVSAGELASVDPALLSYLQICDAPLEPPRGLLALAPRAQLADRHGYQGIDAVAEARALRMLPGEGELPLAELLAALPDDLPVSVEAPSLAVRGELTAAGFATQARRALASLLR
jgi:sugar phosphate isomerase/epimerase